jgi:hypothetical protein
VEERGGEQVVWDEWDNVWILNCSIARSDRIRRIHNIEWEVNCHCKQVELIFS